MSLDSSLILVITIPRTTTKLDNVGVFKASTKVFRVLPNDSHTLKCFLSGKGGSLRKTNLDTILLGFLHALADTAM